MPARRCCRSPTAAATSGHISLLWWWDPSGTFRRPLTWGVVRAAWDSNPNRQIRSLMAAGKPASSWQSSPAPESRPLRQDQACCCQRSSGRAPGSGKARGRRSRLLPGSSESVGQGACGPADPASRNSDHWPDRQPGANRLKPDRCWVLGSGDHPRRVHDLGNGCSDRDPAGSEPGGDPPKPPGAAPPDRARLAA